MIWGALLMLGPVAKVVHGVGVILALGCAIWVAEIPRDSPVRVSALSLGLASLVTALTPVLISLIKAAKDDREAGRRFQETRVKNARVLADALDEVRMLRAERAARDQIIEQLQGRVHDLTEAVRVNRQWVETCLRRLVESGQEMSNLPKLPDLPAGISGEPSLSGPGNSKSVVRAG